MTNDFLTVDQFKAAIAELNREPLSEGEEFFDALEDFRGPEIELDYTPEQDAAYDEWLAKRKEKRAKKRAADHEAETRAKTLAFYNDMDNILNERSLWED
jgi:hypothetical protein